ncbi:MAG: hypothetical protein ACRD5H_00750 [Nitrososphaerales archaeon]
MKRGDFLTGFINHFLVSEELKAALQTVSERYLEMIELKDGEKVEQDNPDAKTCDGCGKLFVNSRRKYCSNKCKGSVWRNQYPDRRHDSFKGKDGKHIVMFQRKNESIEQFKKRVVEAKNSV